MTLSKLFRKLVLLSHGQGSVEKDFSVDSNNVVVGKKAYIAAERIMQDS